MAWSESERFSKWPRKPSTGSVPGGRDRNEDADNSEGDLSAEFTRFGAVGGGEEAKLLDPNLQSSSKVVLSPVLWAPLPRNLFRSFCSFVL